MFDLFALADLKGWLRGCLLGVRDGKVLMSKENPRRVSGSSLFQTPSWILKRGCGCVLILWGVS